MTGVNGPWTSAAFPDEIFPANTYLQMDQQVDGTWTANVYDGTTGARAGHAARCDGPDHGPGRPSVTFQHEVPRQPAQVRHVPRQHARSGEWHGHHGVNILGIDEYVQGVVPAEMIPSWPLEALKAQAVAARSYGAARIKTTGFYDVVPTSVNQVYGGYSFEYAKTNIAAQGTAGIVLWYGDKIANAYFFDTAGGATENSEYAWPTTGGKPGTVIPYLRGIQDKDPNGVPYDIGSVSYSWSSANFTMAQLSNVFKQDSRTNVGTLTSFTFSRGVSGRIYKAVLTGSGGTKTVNGATFKNVYNNHKLAGADLKSTLIYLTPVSP